MKAIQELQTTIIYFIDDFTMDELLILCKTLHNIQIPLQDIGPYLERAIVNKLDIWNADDISFIITSLYQSSVVFRTKFWIKMTEAICQQFDNFSGDSLT